MINIKDKVFKKLCKTLENYDNKKCRKAKILYRVLNEIYNEWSYLT